MDSLDQKWRRTTEAPSGLISKWASPGFDLHKNAEMLMWPPARCGQALPKGPSFLPHVFARNEPWTDGWMACLLIWRLAYPRARFNPQPWVPVLICFAHSFGRTLCPPVDEGRRCKSRRGREGATNKRPFPAMPSRDGRTQGDSLE